MIASLLWKEYRELRPAWVGITAIGGMLLAALSQWMTSGSHETAASVGYYLIAGGLILSWCYGIVSGSLLLAGEAEDGTLSFLDMLPVWRGRLWLAKGLAGVCCLAAQAAVVLLLLVVLGAVRAPLAALGVLAGLLVAGLVGLSWGLFTAARTPTVLGSIVRATGMQALAAGALGLVLLLAWVLLGSPRAIAEVPLPVLFALGAVGLTSAAMIRSARTFAQTDQQRLHPSETAQRVPGVIALLWLARRQNARFSWIVCLVGLLGGLVLFVSPLAVWPLVTLLLGVVCGVRAFAGDEPSRMLIAEHRLPASGMWLVRVLAAFATALLACLAVLAPVVILLHAPRLLSMSAETDNNPFLLFRLLRDPVLREVCTAETFLPLWMLYGLAAGILCGMLLRRIALTAVAALLLAVTGAAVWLPSLFGSGLHGWQILGFPLGLLLASWLLVPRWASGQVWSWPGGARLGAGLTVAAASTALGLWYRVAEAPTVPDRLRLDEFAASLPSPQADETGRLIRESLSVLQVRNSLVRPAESTRPLFGPGTDRESFIFQLSLVLERGWPGGEPELTRWLQQMVHPSWTTGLKQAAGGPTGLVIDPRSQTLVAPVPVLNEAPLAAALLAVDGLRQQARGNDSAYPTNLGIALALARNLKRHALTLFFNVAQRTEADLMAGLDRWLDCVGNKPAVLRQALAVLVEHDAQPPYDVVDTLRCECLLARNGMHDPESILRRLLRNPNARDVNAIAVRAVALAWQNAPWEHRRQERLLGWLADWELNHAAFTRDPRNPDKLIWDQNSVPPLLRSPWLETLSLPRPIRWLEIHDRYTTSQRRAALLKVALRLHQAEHGRPAPNLEALVPQYLPALPSDPYAGEGQTFGYRLSRGEEFVIRRNRIAAPNDKEAVRVPPGRGILFSAGTANSFEDYRRVRITPEQAGAAKEWVYLIDPVGK